MPLSFAEVVDHALFPVPFRWRIGVRSLASTHWLQPDDRRVADLAAKAALLTERPDDVVAVLPGSERAGAEVLALVRDDLARRGLPLVEGGDHPLDRAARSVQEDLCLMEPRDGRWVLTAGSVCFPTDWRLADKIGGTLAEIHAPVPGYAETLGDRVERFFDRMSPGALAWRLNWSLVTDPARRLEPGRQTDRADAGLGDRHLRVERQTLRRLVDHDAIVFGIRIHVWPLADVLDLLPGDAPGATLASMPAAVARYKNLERLRDELGRG